MAIEVGTPVNDTASGTGLVHTFSYTVTAGSQYLVVLVTMNCEQASQGITSVTYDGDAMTKAKDGAGDGCSSNAKQGVYYIATPSSGANDVVVTYSGSGSQESSVSAIELKSGVGETPLGSNYSNCQSGDATRNLTPTASQGIVFDTIIGSEDGTPAVDGMTQLHSTTQESTRFGGASYKIFDSSPVAMNWNNVDPSPTHVLQEFQGAAADDNALSMSNF